MSPFEQIKQQNVELKVRLAEAEKARDQYRKLYELSREEAERLRRGLLGQKAERLPADVKQLSLHILEEILGSEPEIEEPAVREVKAHRRRKTNGRKPLPDHLPTEEIILTPVEVEENPEAYECIGEDVSDVVERRPSSLVKVRTRRKKYAPLDRKRNESTKIYQAAPLELPIVRGLAGPGMLADTIVKRWDDHIPLNRLENVYGREGLDLARSTICGWHEQLAVLAGPLIAAMFEDALKQPYLCTDATGVLVQAKEKCRHGHFWVLVAPERHVLFRYSKRHTGKAVDALLGDYEGYLVADAHTVYDHLYVDDKVKECNCWAHCRRYFFNALSSDPDRAKVALSLIAQLFRIERKLAGSPRKKREKERRKKSAPVVDKFYAWCKAQRDEVLDDTPISKGIGYAMNQEKGLRQFLDDGRIPIDNNISERELRREVVGRKNWLFVGSDDAATVNATFVSLLASCRMHHVEPWAYLRDLFCLLPDWSTNRLIELAPGNWEKTHKEPETQRRLEANPIRCITL